MSESCAMSTPAQQGTTERSPIQRGNRLQMPPEVSNPAQNFFGRAVKVPQVQNPREHNHSRVTEFALVELRPSTPSI